VQIEKQQQPQEGGGLEYPHLRILVIILVIILQDFSAL
jgi:hypothetical protein